MLQDLCGGSQITDREIAALAQLMDNADVRQRIDSYSSGAVMHTSAEEEVHQGHPVSQASATAKVPSTPTMTPINENVDNDTQVQGLSPMTLKNEIADNEDDLLAIHSKDSSIVTKETPPPIRPSSRVHGDATMTGLVKEAIAGNHSVNRHSMF